MRIKSVKFKISILYTMILGIVLILYSGFLYFSLYSTLYSDLDNELVKKAESISEGINAYLEILDIQDQNDLVFVARRILTLKGDHPTGKKNLTPDQKKQIIAYEKDWSLKYDKLDLSEDIIHFISSDGQSLAKSSNMTNEFRSVFLNAFKNNKSSGNSFSRIKFQKRNLRFLQTPYLSERGETYIIQIGSSQRPVIELLENRQKLIVFSIPIILILTSFVGLFLSNKILQPINEIAQTAQKITYEDLSERIQLADVDEEMRTLVESFNNMISRLDNSFKHIVEFSSQVAHELKTPIAILRGEIELSLRKERSKEEYKRVLTVGLEEAKRLLKTIDDLLLLARLDYRPELFEFGQFDITEFFKELHEQTKILAIDKNIKTKLKLPEQEIGFDGNKLHLRRLFYNIIHNAIKFTPNDGSIDIIVEVKDSNLVAKIVDSGVGISEENQSKVFERFFHIENSQQTAESGNGLGLNIALSIAKIHHGNIEVQSHLSKGTTCIVTLPIS